MFLYVFFSLSYIIFYVLETEGIKVAIITETVDGVRVGAPAGGVGKI